MAHTIKTTLPCVDAHVTTVGETIQQGKRYVGSFVYEDDDNVRFIEKQSQHVEHPELHWKLLDRSKHGRVNINSRHVKVEFYIHHDEYADGRDLADMLAREIETLGENLCEMNLKEEAEKCGK